MLKRITHVNGDVLYYNEDNQLHREDGPAFKNTISGVKQWRHKGEFHRIGGPAVTWGPNDREWCKNGLLHREDGPAVVSKHKKEWWVNGYKHRIDGPAIECADGQKEWWVNGKRHRLNGPAIEWPTGTNEWWCNDDLHCLTGPAVIEANGKKEWWVFGKKLDNHPLSFWLKQRRLYSKFKRGDLTESQLFEIKMVFGN